MAEDKNTTGKMPVLRSVYTVKGIRYVINSVLLPGELPHIITNAFLHEASVETIQEALPKTESIKEDGVKELMKQHHESMKRKLKSKHADATISESEYMRKIRRSIAKGALKDALSMNEDALALFTNNPFFMTYYGYLKAAVMKDHKKGMEICKSALETYSAQAVKKKDRNLSHFHLNIGRVYLLSGKKDFGIASYRKGFHCDPRNKDVIEELAKLGIRRPPPIPFLSRTNPINKYFGIFLSRIGLR